METSRSTCSLPSGDLPRMTLGKQLPWGTALFALFLALVAFLKSSAAGPSSTQGNVLLTVSLGAGTALAVSTFPAGTLHTFLGLYLALEVLAVNSMVGYSTLTYLSLVIAGLLACCIGQFHKSSIALPGIPWLLCLAVVVFLQFIRSASMRDAFPVLCDEIAFTLVLWSFSQIPRTDIGKATAAFIVGTCGAGLAFLFLSPLTGSRLGFDLGFNSNELGNVVGAALLLLASSLSFRRQRVMFWGIAGILGVLLVLSESRTSTYACFGGIVLFLFLRRKRWIAVSLALAAVALVLVSYWKQLDDDPFALAGRLASPVSLSFEESSAQRAKIWGFLLTQVSDHWKWGIGLRNVSEMTAEAGIGTTVASNNFFTGYQAHNLYLTLLLELGILGLVLLLGWQLRILSWGFRRPFDNALLICMMLYLMSEGFFQGVMPNFLSAFLLIAAWRVQSEPRTQ